LALQVLLKFCLSATYTTSWHECSDIHFCCYCSCVLPLPTINKRNYRKKVIFLPLMLVPRFTSVKICVPHFQFVMLPIHSLYHCFVRSTHCSSIRSINGSWLRHLVMQLLSILLVKTIKKLACFRQL
jgi:hypothetical protein